MRVLSAEQTRAAFDILVRHCGVRGDAERWNSFEYHSARTTEYRFMGALGFGGKFRNNGNRGGVPYVDCYPEDETPERRAMIERANQELAELFAPKTTKRRPSP